MIRATVLMLAAWVIGLGIGSVAQRTIEEHLDEYPKQNPVSSQDSQVTAEGDEGSPPEELAEGPVETGAEAA